MDSRCEPPPVHSLSVSNLRKWIFFIPKSIPKELLIQSHDHILLIAACYSSNLKNIQALYGQVRHSKCFLRQMLSIATFRNRKDLATYFFWNKVPAWTPTISILFIVASSVENHSLLVSFSSLTAWTSTSK